LLLTLSKDVCLTAEGGHVINTKAIAVFAKSWRMLHFKSAGHTRVTGDLDSPQTGHDPLEDLLLQVSP
jgi:hypothetical protein